jgi:hypothetical protein
MPQSHVATTLITAAAARCTDICEADCRIAVSNATWPESVASFEFIACLCGAEVLTWEAPECRKPAGGNTRHRRALCSSGRWQLRRNRCSWAARGHVLREGPALGQDPDVLFEALWAVARRVVAGYAVVAHMRASAERGSESTADVARTLIVAREAPVSPGAKRSTATRVRSPWHLSAQNPIGSALLPGPDGHTSRPISTILDGIEFCSRVPTNGTCGRTSSQGFRTFGGTRRHSELLKRSEQQTHVGPQLAVS